MKKKLAKVIDKYKSHPEFLGIDILEPNQKGAVDSTILHISARTGDLESIEVLLEAGANIDAAGDMGNTPLHEAAMRGQIESVRILIQHGANLLVKNEFNQTATDVAELGGHEAVANLLRGYSISKNMSRYKRSR